MRLEILKTGSHQRQDLLSVTIFMVFISFAKISAPSSASSFVNGTTVQLQKFTESNRPWPSHEFLRSVIDGSVNTTSNANSKQNTSKSHSSIKLPIDDGNTNTQRALHTPAISVGLPLSFSAPAPEDRIEDRSSRDPIKYVKISAKHGSFDSRERHWQRLNKTGVIVSKNNGFGWYGSGGSGAQDLYLPAGFSVISPGPQYHQYTTPLSVGNSYGWDNYGTTGRPIVIVSTADAENHPSSTKWYQPIPVRRPEVSAGRPSVIIVKNTDKVSSHHWGSSGSTLPPVASASPEFHYSGGNIVSSTVSPITALPSPLSGGNSFYASTPNSIWFKPTLNQYTTTVAPIILTAKPEASSSDPNKSILFKIWSYLDDGNLKLQDEKKIPAWILSGHHIKDGDILNYEKIPLPIKHLLASSLDKNVGTNENTRWQQLPILIPGSNTATNGWGAPTIKERPVSLNYVIWGSSTTQTPPVVPLLPAPDDYQKYLQEYLNRLATPAPPKQESSVDTWLLLQNYFQNQMATRFPILQGQNPIRVGGDANANNLANLAMLQTILAFLSKQTDIPQSPKNPNPTTNNDITRLRPPNRDIFWSSLYPIYQHLLTKAFPVPSVNRDADDPFAGSAERQPQSNPLSLGNYNTASPQDYPIAITEGYSASGESYHKPLVVTKTGKKGRRKRRKKCKKYSKHGHGGWGILPSFLYPHNLDFNYSFGVDFLDILKKKFYALVALKLAPILIISIAAVVPLAFLLWPQVFKMFKDGMNHYNPFREKHHHHSHKHHPQNPYHHHHGQYLPHILDYAKHYNPHLYDHYPASGYYQDQLSLGDSNTGISSSAIRKSVENHQHSQYPASAVASLVEQKFGDKYSYRNVTEPWLGRNKLLLTTRMTTTTTTMQPYFTHTGTYSDVALDTPYNRNVMQVLMKNKNVKTKPPRVTHSIQVVAGRSISSDLTSHSEEILNKTNTRTKRRARFKLEERIVQIPSSIIM